MEADDSKTVDVVVAGAGPAGATVARLLATWGHRVLMVAPPHTGGPRLAESLPPSTRKLLQTLDLTEIVARAGFIETTGNTIWWGRDRDHAGRFEPGARGLQVPREIFDRLLVDAAAASGVSMTRGAVQALETSAGHVRVGVSGPGAGQWAARLFVDASGRAGIRARRGLRRMQPGYAMLGLVATWRRAGGWGLADESHTLVEAFAGGWAWSVPVSPTDRMVAVMVPRETAATTVAGVERAYAATLAGSVHLARLTAEAQRISRPWGCDASVYDASQYAGPGFLLTGDAASTLDPLSSFGVKKALASGYVTAVAAHTLIGESTPSGVVQAFHAAREQEMYAAALAASTRFAREAADAYGTPFWMHRAAVVVDPAFGGSPESRLARHPSVQAALAVVKSDASLRVRPGRPLATVSHPLIRGRSVVVAPALRLPTLDEPLHYLGGVDLVTLASLADPSGTPVSTLIARVEREGPGVEMSDAVLAIAVLVAEGLFDLSAARAAGATQL